MQRGMIIKSEICVDALQSTVRRFGEAGDDDIDYGQREVVSSLYKDNIHQPGDISQPEILACDTGPRYLGGRRIV